jgi:hypothetical protein
MPADGHINSRLVACLWLVLVSHVVVNNYSNMRVVVGLGIWWLALGTIASVVTRFTTPAGGNTRDDRPVATAAGPRIRPAILVGQP